MRKTTLLAASLLALSVTARSQNFTTITNSVKISNGNGNFGSNVITSNDFFGDAVANIGDLDGDGNPDLAVGADYFDTQNVTNAGSLYILFLNSDGTVKSKVKHTMTGASRFGLSVCSLGDLDGDRIQDIAVGAVGNDNFKGAVYICFMKSDGSIKSSSVIKSGTTNFATLTSGAIFGSKTVNAGDLNSDGVTDILVGCPTDPDGGASRGSVFLIYLKSDGTVKGYKKLSSTSGNLPFTLDNDDQFGSALAAIGDINNDGVTDIAVGAYRDDDGYTDAGAVYILTMNSDGTVKSSNKISNSNAVINGNLAVGAKLGVSITKLSDYSIKGGFTLATGVRDDASNSVPKGAVYLLNFSKTGVLESYSKLGDQSSGFSNQLDNDDRFGLDIADLGIVGNDSTGKMKRLAIGAAFDDDGVTNAGAVYIVDIAQQVTTGIKSTATHLSVGKLSVYPNPFTTGLNISFQSDKAGNYDIAVLDLNGRVLMQTRYTLQAGVQSINLIDMPDMAPGMYYVRVSNGKEAAAIKKIIRSE